MNRCRVFPIALCLILAASPAHARPAPGGAGGGFRLFAAARTILAVNRAQCDLTAGGEICAVTAQGLGGGVWPRGTADRYIWASGLQVAGLIGPAGGPWAGDLAGAFFHNSSFGNLSGELVTQILRSDDPADRALIEAGTDATGLAARVPLGDVTEALFHPVLRGRPLASEADAWWLNWEGNPALTRLRDHPLGLLVETRALAWNYPRGNEDIIYFLFTFYNITSLRPADYAAIRPGMRDLVLERAREFHRLNNATLPEGELLPDSGWTIEDMYIAVAADMDVGQYDENYATANLPLAMGYTYDRTFARPGSWTFDPAIFAAPFFPGPGFAGIKYLKSPELNGTEVGLSLFTAYAPGGSVQDPGSMPQQYRLMRGVPDPVLGDGSCNTGNPQLTHVCYINNAQATDTRFMQASGPLQLAPGGLTTIAVAYVFAAPVAIPGCPVPCDVRPGDPRVFLDPATVGAAGQADSMAGYLGYAGDLNGNLKVDQEEILTVPGSLLGKARIAQAVFDNRYLLPFSPESPEFFLIPGDGQVTVMWRPSASESGGGDPYSQLASQATTQGVPNPLYDPNYRQYDVEGYRIYRGRIDSPSSMRLIAQFDYGGTFLEDYAGQVNPTSGCAPELGITSTCAVVFDPVQPGVQRQAHVDVPLVGPIVQVRLGDRVPLASGDALILAADTAITGVATAGCGISSCQELTDTGVPFVFVDREVRNSFRYFYAVTAFDINSFQSGPGSLESPRRTRSVTPSRPAANYDRQGSYRTELVGRGTPLTDSILPVLDPVTGRFSKPMPPSPGWTLALTALVPELLPGPGSVRARLDSLVPGNAYDDAPTEFYVTLVTATDSFSTVLPLVQDQFAGARAAGVTFAALTADPALAARYGANGQYTLTGRLEATLPGNYFTSAFGRGCINGGPGFRTNQADCDYNGARWFDGPSPARNETSAHPNGCSRQNAGSPTPVTCFNNAGELTGVATLYEAKSYQTAVNVFRNVEGMLGGAVRGADYNVYWGNAGAIDSVIDITHNVPVPFSPAVGAGWGFLNAAATAAYGPGINYDERAAVTVSDFACVPPLRASAAVQSVLPCPAATYALGSIAVPGPVAFFSGPLDANRTAPVATNGGFGLAMPGHLFLIELAGSLPAAGTVWSLRDYTGAIRGGGSGCAQCQAGDDGPYAFHAVPAGLAAPGVELRLSYDVVNQVHPPTDRDLAAVHTVPDPYYVTNPLEQTPDAKQLKFVNLPQDAIVRIYSSSGVLVRLLEHHSSTAGGELTWDLRSRNSHVVASGVYFYHIEAGPARRVGRFTIVSWAN